MYFLSIFFSLSFHSLQQKCADSSDGNIIISPYSVATAIALLSQGALGKTFDQIANGLHLPNDKAIVANLFHELSTSFAKYNELITLDVANNIYVKQGYQIKNSFKDIATKKFHSGIEAINFADNVASANTINRWVEQKTNDKIKDLISSDALSDDTRLVLVNAIYFKGNWQNKFNKALTAPGSFFVNENDSVDVQYMHVKAHFKFGYFEDLDATAIELPYVDSNVSFIVVLPNKRDGLSLLEAKMKEYDITKLTQQLYRQEVEVTLPKFKIEYEVNLNNVLKKVRFSPSGRHDKRKKGFEKRHMHSSKNWLDFSLFYSWA